MNYRQVLIFHPSIRVITKWRHKINLPTPQNAICKKGSHSTSIYSTMQKKKILFCFCTLYSQMMQVMKQAGQFLFLSFFFPIHVFCKLGIFFHIYSSFLANFAVIKCTIQIDSSNFLHSQNIKFYTLIQYRILAYFRFIFVVFDWLRVLIDMVSVPLQYVNLCIWLRYRKCD